MDTRTGQIYQLEEGESPKDLADRLGAQESDIVALERLPKITCSKCRGKGYVKKGLLSKRFKPCKCTL